MSKAFALVALSFGACFEGVEVLGLGLAGGTPVKAPSEGQRQVIVANLDVRWDGGENGWVDAVVCVFRNRDKGQVDVFVLRCFTVCCIRYLTNLDIV